MQLLTQFFTPRIQTESQFDAAAVTRRQSVRANVGIFWVALVPSAAAMTPIE